MTDETPRKGRRPDHTVWFINDRPGAPWVAIGAAWSHNDGDGFNMQLDLLPNAPGRFVLRRPKSEGEAG